MKYSLKKLQQEYTAQNFNKKLNFSHSIDKETYKILCEEYFNQENTAKAINLAEECLKVSLESENVFVEFLNKE